jgi:surface carbohydrate biosynthesis protein
MATVCLPIEIKDRELDGKLWLSYNFIERGHEVIIGPSWEVKNTIDITKPDVYITKDPGDNNVSFINQLQKAGILSCVLSTESGLNIGVENYYKNTKEMVSAADVFFSWGSKPTDELKKYSEMDGKIKTVGNPRFDLATKELKSVYDDEKERLVEKHGEFILINTNFPLANPLDKKSQEKIIERNIPIEIQEKKRYTQALYMFLDLIIFLSSSDLEYDYVLRPHPAEDNSIYNEKFGSYSNITVNNKGDVRPWLHASKCTIHYDCTTGIEAAMMGVPVISYDPFSEYNEYNLSKAVSKTADTREKVKNWIANTSNINKEYTLSSYQKSKLLEFFPNIKELAAPQICDIIDKKLSEYEGYSGYNLDKTQKFERIIKTMPFNSTVEDIYDLVRDAARNSNYSNKRKKTRTKFSGLSEEETINKNILKHTSIDGVDVEPIPKSNYTYKLY